MEQPSRPRPISPPGEWSQVTIVGLGLLGGSLAHALRHELPNVRLVGVERREAVRADWVPALVHECWAAEEHSQVLAAFRASDLVFLATPVRAIQSWLAQALPCARLVSDCGSTKRAIIASARALGAAGHFVPGHPMAGGSGGLAAASRDLFRAQAWVLCPEGVEAPALEALEELVLRLGARPVRLRAEDHDRAVALTSHAPRLLASALVVAAERGNAFAAAGPAFERLSRVAGGTPEVWADIFGSNADEISRALEEILDLVRACSSELSQGDRLQSSLELLLEAERARRGFDAKRGGQQ